MRWKAVVVACSLVVATSATSAGCARYFACGPEGAWPKGLTEADLVGQYVGSPSGKLELKADGTMRATDWPKYDVFGDNPELAPQEVRGTWRIRPGSHKTPHGDFAEDDLDLTGADGGFAVSGSRENPRLYRGVGDPDGCHFHEFKRVE
ncbi:hypothetical protein [Streptomyces sp. NPDC045369]|uniref:hypothetical protein n=1 Tax=Streptomyces sp. NPDC045369 TaxID=3155732 RepID=UPI0033E9DA16